MPTEVQTKRVRRSWTDRLQLWPRAYQTKISDERHEAFGRGPSPEASRNAAMQRWMEAQRFEDRGKATLLIGRANRPCTFGVPQNADPRPKPIRLRRGLGIGTIIPL